MHNLTRLIVLTFLITTLPAFEIYAQRAEPSVDQIIVAAAEQRSLYLETFLNLLSEETKSFETYDRDGQVKKRRVVRSTFIVYQLSKDPAKITEYRNVISVDGKDVAKTDLRAQNFFEQVVKAESSEKELERIHDESLRFDDEIYISNLTLFQSVALAETLRPNFTYVLKGKETIDGREVHVIDYQQKGSSPNISISGGARPALGLSYDVELRGLKNPNERLSGTFWIDATTFQVVREHRLFTVQPEGFEQRTTLSENRFDFKSSGFGILTPTRISHLQFDIDKKKRTSVKDVQVVFEYDKFTRPDVEVRSNEVKP